MDLNRSLLEQLDRYIERIFVTSDAALTRNLVDSKAAGLPEISVSPNQGKFLSLLVAMTRARRVLEIGTLGGYSTTWLARALGPDGVLISLELMPNHAEVARRNIARAKVDPAVDIRVGSASDSLRAMIAAGEPAFDFIFIDADKPSYSEYLELSLQLARAGTVIVADNVIRNGAVLDGAEADENARAMRVFNAALAAHPRLDSIVVPIMREHIDGISISIVRQHEATG